MKPPSKPKSSPARTDEFPPPFIMFPRTKSSRGIRSRSNRRFIRKIITGNDANQEPSSPKVTCIGQVRVKRRSNNKQTTPSAASRRCKFLRGWFQRVWRRKISVFGCDCCRKSEKLQESTVNQIKREIDVIGACKDELILESPPRNAVLLTRSRSAPYRYLSGGNETVKDETEGVGEDIGEEDEGSINGGLSRCKSEPARTGDKLVMSFGYSL